MLKVIGHRGARGLAAENTVSSVQAALQYGVDEIEIDVRVTRDGVPVVIHDKTLQRLAGSGRSVAECTLAELRQLKSDIPTLDEIIRTINRRVPLLIEVKPKEPAAPIIAIIEHFLAAGWQPRDFLFGSFSQHTLRELHRLLPRIPTVIIANYLSVWAVHRARQLRTKRLSMCYRYFWPGFVASMRRRGYQLYGYSMNDPRAAERLKRYGLSGVITDYPDRFAAPAKTAPPPRRNR